MASRWVCVWRGFKKPCVVDSISTFALASITLAAPVPPTFNLLYAFISPKLKIPFGGGKPPKPLVIFNPPNDIFAAVFAPVKT